MLLLAKGGIIFELEILWFKRYLYQGTGQFFTAHLVDSLVNVLDDMGHDGVVVDEMPVLKPRDMPWVITLIASEASLWAVKSSVKRLTVVESLLLVTYMTLRCDKSTTTVKPFLRVSSAPMAITPFCRCSFMDTILVYS